MAPSQRGLAALQDWPALRSEPRGVDDTPEAVLLLHGLTQQSHAFDAVAGRLTTRHRCEALDFRGRGESEWAEGT